VRLVKSGGGEVLLDLLRNQGVDVRSDCGGLGLCGKCVVKVLSGAFSESSLSERRVLGELILDGFRLACQTRLFSEEPLGGAPE